MKSAEDSIFFVKEVESVVAAIPRGFVLTYGDVASLAGRPTSPRQVGQILSAIVVNSDIPCHRVVNFQGRTAPHWHTQANLLKAEGVTFRKPDFVNMKLHRWIPEKYFI